MQRRECGLHSRMRAALANFAALPAITVALAMMLAIGLLATRDPLPRWVAGQDRGEHFLGFAIVAGLWLFKSTRRGWKLLILIECAALAELAQANFLPTRSGSLIDFAWSLAGVAAGLAGAYFAQKTLRGRLVSERDQ